MLNQIFALLDHRWVTRASNAVFLASIAIFIGTRVFDALQHIGWLAATAYAGIALGLVLMLLERIGKRRAHEEIDLDEDGPALWAAQQEAKERRIQRIAEKEINR
ncbi:MAG TPA: hypothetical protein VK691_10245 [Solirubrobacteraceae bacterium]|nr:hypothetical protein [Solirubrobacteraceae bacterium]